MLAHVNLSAARNGTVAEKIAAVFEGHWQQPDFEAYDRATFEEAMRRNGRIDQTVIRSFCRCRSLRASP